MFMCVRNGSNSSRTLVIGVQISWSRCAYVCQLIPFACCTVSDCKHSIDIESRGCYGLGCYRGR